MYKKIIWISTDLFLLWNAEINQFNIIKISLVFFYSLRYVILDVITIRTRSAPNDHSIAKKKNTFFLYSQSDSGLDTQVLKVWQ